MSTTAEMPVNTKQVARREVEYATLDDFVAEAQRAVAEDLPTQGNWSKGMILDHLTKTINCTLDGFGFKAPLFFRILGPFMKNGLLKKPMPAGYKLSGDSVKAIGPQEIDAKTSIENLRAAVTRFQAATEVAHHPFFGKMTYEEVELLHRRHAALHMSFIELS